MSTHSKTTITVIEHTVFFKFKDGYTDEQEIDMYKGLWSFKDYFPSIMCMSLDKYEPKKFLRDKIKCKEIFSSTGPVTPEVKGRVLAKEAHGVTHGLVMRFASKEALATYLADDYRIEISRKTITPFQTGEYSVDFEAEVHSDLSELYKEGEKFDGGVKHVELFKFKEGTSPSEVEELLNIWADLPNKCQTDVVQLTSGTNYKPNDVFTHAVVVRLPSAEGLEEFIKDPAYVGMHEKVDSIVDDYLSVDYIVGESKKMIQEESYTEVDA